MRKSILTRRITRLIVLALLATTLTGIGATAARADNPLFQYPGGALEGGNPNTMGCTYDAQTVQSVPVTGWQLSYATGKNVLVNYGTLQLRYSPRCQTNWARAILHSPISPYSGTHVPVAMSWAPAAIRVEGGMSNRYYTYVYAQAAYDLVFYTNMVYSPTMPRPDPYSDPPDCARAKVVLNPWSLADFLGPIGSNAGKWAQAVTGCF
jgi:Protein of unknown function (DUF2690)